MTPRAWAVCCLTLTLLVASGVGAWALTAPADDRLLGAPRKQAVVQVITHHRLVRQVRVIHVHDRPPLRAASAVGPAPAPAGSAPANAAPGRSTPQPQVEHTAASGYREDEQEHEQEQEQEQEQEHEHETGD